MFREWKELFRFRKLEPEDRSIVFYAEDEGYWTYLESLVGELTGPLGESICYVTSSATDPVLETSNERIRPFYIGSGTARTTFFASLEAKVMVMTMTDLGNYHMKRSKHPVHYVYAFHSLVSTHMSYRSRSFDNYDSVLCVGPHQTEEIRQTEALHGLKSKVLVEAGYGRLDTIIRSRSGETGPDPNHIRRVLVAPSWGPNSLLETHGEQLLELLLAQRYLVTLRPHAMAIRLRRSLLKNLQARFGSDPNFSLDLRPASQGTVEASDLMICDWGGSALEYAFGLERPVLFIDVPKKVFNPAYEAISCEPLEVAIRSQIGAVLPPEDLAQLPELVDGLCSDPGAWRERIRELRSKWVYNVGASGSAGAAHVLEAAGQPPEPAAFPAPVGMGPHSRGDV